MTQQRQGNRRVSAPNRSAADTQTRLALDAAPTQRVLDRLIDESLLRGPSSDAFSRLVQYVTRHSALYGRDTPTDAARGYVELRLRSRSSAWAADPSDHGDPTDGAIEQVGVNTDNGWRDEARRALRVCAARRDYFTSDDVNEEMSGEYHTHEPRAMGAVMVWGARAGLIRPTGSHGNTRRRQSHRSPRTIWASVERVGLH